LVAARVHYEGAQIDDEIKRTGLIALPLDQFLSKYCFVKGRYD
jgi:hypothetical protein